MIPADGKTKDLLMSDVLCLILEFEESMTKNIQLQRQAAICQLAQKHDLWVDFQFAERGIQNLILLDALPMLDKLSGTKVDYRSMNHLAGVITPSLDMYTSEDLVPDIVYVSCDNGVDERKFRQAQQLLGRQIEKLVALVRELFSLYPLSTTYLIFSGVFAVREGNYHICEIDNLAQTINDIFADTPTVFPDGVIKVSSTN